MIWPEVLYVVLAAMAISRFAVMAHDTPTSRRLLFIIAMDFITLFLILSGLKWSEWMTIGKPAVVAAIASLYFAPVQVSAFWREEELKRERQEIASNHNSDRYAKPNRSAPLRSAPAGQGHVDQQQPENPKVIGHGF